MLKRLLLIGTIIYLAGISQVMAQRIVGYLPSYRDVSSSLIRYNCLTDVYFSFINFRSNGTLYLDNNTAPDGVPAFGFEMPKFTTVKTYCKPQNSTGPNLWIAVGGADNSGARKARFESVCGNPTTRATLISELVAFGDLHNLHGIDIDWEFPANNATSRANHEALVAELRTAINAHNVANPTQPMKLSMCVGGETNSALASPTHQNYMNATSLQYCDFIHVMSYDLPASYGSNHTSVTRSQQGVTSWQAYGGAGTPWSKMTIGIAFYGRPDPRGADLTRNYSDETNYITAFNSANGQAGTGGYYYDSKSMIETKVDWIMTQGGSGVLIWDIGQDRASPYNLQDVTCTRMATACIAPQPALGADVGICLPGSTTLNSGVSTASGRTFAWTRDGSPVAGTGPTLTVTTGGLYRVTVTQASCSRFDEINVVTSNPVTGTGGSRCGTGTVNLTASGSGTLEWYDATTAGNLLGTGTSFTTPSISANTTYYVQQATGSVTNYTGKATINVPSAQVEFASDANPGTKPQWTHKFTALQSLNIESVMIYTNGTARSNARIQAYSALDGSLVAQSAALNIPAMAAGTPYILNCNLALSSGTYYVGIYIPSTNTGNACIWHETPYAPTAPFTIAGVSSIEAKAYQGNFMVAAPSTGYGQLYNWVITTGVVNPCTRTAVLATVTAAASPSLAVTTTTPTLCTGNATVRVAASETGVSYQAYLGATALGSPANGTGGNLDLTFPVTALVTGANTITVQATKTGCGMVTLTQSVSITRSAGPSTPSAISGNAAPCQGATQTYSVTNVSGITYAWTMPSGWTGTSTTNSISATVGSGSGNITVTATNGCGTSTAATLAVAPGLLPAAPSAISGNASPCSGASVTYTVGTVSGVTFMWTFPSGWTITSGNGTNSVTVTAGATGGSASVMASNPCGNSTATTLTLTPTAGPAQPSIITGSANPCQGTATTYSVVNVSGVTYNWTLPSGWTGTSTSNSISATPSATAANISVTAQTACGTSTARTLAVAPIATPAQPATIGGNTTVCSATSQTYTVTNVTGMTYNWTLPSGWSGTSTTNSITATTGTTGGTISVTAQNACGTSTARTLAVTISGAATAPGSISGTAAVCSGVAQTYSIATVSGATGYIWTLPSGWTGTSTTTSISATPTATGGTISVVAVGACGNSSPSTLVVTSSAAPAQPSVVTGSATPCQGTATTYSVVTVSGVTYNWTLPSGWTGTSTSNSISATPSATAANISVTAQTACGTSTARTFAVAPIATPAQPATIGGNTTVCSATSQTYTVTNVSGMTYNWTLPSGWSGTSTTNSITVNTGTSGGTISVTAQNACGTSTARTLAVTISGAATAPGSISGSATVCSGVAQTYSIATVSGATGYIWTLPSGWTGTSTTTSISATPNATGGTISVVAVGACGNSSASTLVATSAATPSQPSVITGSATPCQGTATTYAVTNVSGVTYNWTLPSGWTGTSSTNSISATPSATAANISVTAQTACGTSTARTLAVAPTVAPTQPSTMTGSTTVCSATSQTYAVTNVTGMTYNWTLPSGWSGTSTSNSITASTGTSGGTISVTAQNACGTSTARTLAVTISGAATAPGAITGSAAVCSGVAQTYSIAAVSGATSYIWTLPSGWTGTSTTTSISATPNGTGGTVSVVAVGSCGNSSPSTRAVTASAAPAQPSVITGTASVVPPQTLSYSVSSVSGVTYTWAYTGTGATIASGQGTASVTVNYGSGATSGNLTVTPSNGCGNGTVRTLAVTAGSIAPQPGDFTTSSSSVCQGQTGVAYTVPNVSGTTYTWSYTGTGATFTSGQGTNSVVVSFSASATSGNMSVIANNGGSNSTPRSMAVTVTTGTVSAPSSITGPGSVFVGQTDVTYFVPAEAGMTYTWTYTGTGATLNPSAGVISIDFGPTATAGNLEVVASSACGSAAPVIKAITMIGGPTSVINVYGNASAMGVYPNPYTVSSTVELLISESSTVSLRVFDAYGQEVAILEEGRVLSPGEYSYTLGDLPAGVYMVSLNSENDTKAIRVVKQK
jgi:GH18 family chitinase